MIFSYLKNCNWNTGCLKRSISPKSIILEVKLLINIKNEIFRVLETIL